MFDLMITLLSINQIETDSWSINKMIIKKKNPAATSLLKDTQSMESHLS